MFQEGTSLLLDDEDCPALRADIQLGVREVDDYHHLLGFSVEPR